MIVAQISQEQANVSPVDAIWTLVQCQTKSVQRALTKRFLALDAEQRAKRKTDTISRDLKSRLDAARKDIKEGRGTFCQTREELDAFFAEL